MNEQTHKTVLLFALAGVFVGGAAGWAFGAYVVPQLGNQPLAGKDAGGWMCGWIFAILGGLGGWRTGNEFLHRQRKLAQKQARLEKYADQLERFKQEKEAEEAREAERKRLREERFGRDDRSSSSRR